MKEFQKSNVLRKKILRTAVGEKTSTKEVVKGGAMPAPSASQKFVSPWGAQGRGGERAREKEKA